MWCLLELGGRKFIIASRAGPHLKSQLWTIWPLYKWSRRAGWPTGTTNFLSQHFLLFSIRKADKNVRSNWHMQILHCRFSSQTYELNVNVLHDIFKIWNSPYSDKWCRERTSLKSSIKQFWMFFLHEQVWARRGLRFNVTVVVTVDYWARPGRAMNCLPV